MPSPLKSKDIQAFQAQIWDYYRCYGRTFQWRETSDPFHIVVSEVMLQQTQTFRVEPKFEQFINSFPTFKSLANASLADVLIVWQGLGYNRRARFLQQLAMQVINEFDGILPANPAQLETLPGIGKATASSICAFAFNKPTVFIETNIRTVFIAHFFKQQEKVHDRDIMPLVQQTIDHLNPREWYYALMDYGVYLKKLSNNKIALQSAHYVRQSPFEGSDRQIRSNIIKMILSKTSLAIDELLVDEADKERTARIIEQLIKEGFLKKEGQILSINNNTDLIETKTL